ncbi:MAG: AMP-binding protein, partial [Bacteroidaceae bacterium]|nr:AMP-binding protein [Bacteroidaceae bacterium]
MLTLEEQIEYFSKLTPDKPAVIWGDETLSYSSLWKRIQEKASLLKGEGLSEGKSHVFISKQDVDFIITYCATHHCGGICVPLESSTPKERQQQIREEVNGKCLNGECSDILYTTGTTGKA